ncbi:MAG: hypothetical protein CMJ78_08145 [Planctomycetaceae bacterium]|nr:hypothetical protein [Planctomycetaceae bacterium]
MLIPKPRPKNGKRIRMDEKYEVGRIFLTPAENPWFSMHGNLSKARVFSGQELKHGPSGSDKSVALESASF